MQSNSGILNKKLATIDLTKEKIKIEEIPLSLRRAYLGGRGLNGYYLYKMLGKNVDPLSAENILIFGTGFLTGTLAPNSSRFNITTKSPETYFFGDTNCGGFFAPELRYAGFDRIILKGKANSPKYLYVNDGKIEIRDAKNYWGMDTIEVQKQFRNDLGDCEIACIGVAGENLVRLANVRTGIKNSAGRCGTGAVMGSKNLKAIVSYGTEGVGIKFPEKFLKLIEEIKNYLMGSKITPILGSMGTPLLYEISNEFGAIRTKNSQLNAWVESLNAEEIHKYVEKMISCSSCIIHCRHRNTLGGEGPEYTAVGLLGSNIGIKNPKEVIELNNICNDFGLDISSVGTILAWAFELYEKKLIDKKMTEEELKFGDFELTKKLLYKISRRQGFGNILAESTQATKIFGEKSKDYLIAVKNLPQSDPHDVRYIKAFALGIATSSRGGDHLRSRPTLEIFFKLPQEVIEQIYGKGIAREPYLYEGKEKTVYFSDNIFATIDSLGICKFICHGFNSPHFLKYSHFKDLIYYSSGLEFTEKQLQEVGKRIIDTERLFNLREGLTKKDDTLPKRYFDDQMPLKIAKGHKIEREKFAEMLKGYYKLRGWTENGEVKEERKREIEGVE